MGQASLVQQGIWLSVADYSWETSCRAEPGVRLPTTQASTSVSTGLQAMHTQASPAMVARFSNGVRGFLLGNAGPQLIPLAIEYMQMTKAIPGDVLTMRTQDGQPTIHGVFADAQQPFSGPDTPTFRQGRCPAQVWGGIRADARIRCAGPRRRQHGADLTAQTRPMPMPTSKLQPDIWRHPAIQDALRIPAVTWLVVHLGDPRHHCSAEHICLVVQFELEKDLAPL